MQYTSSRFGDRMNQWRLTLWCAALALGCFAASVGAEAPTWPREVTVSGMKTVIYQPQLESFKSDRLTARSAISVVPKGKAAPVFAAKAVRAIAHPNPVPSISISIRARVGVGVSMFICLFMLFILGPAPPFALRGFAFEGRVGKHAVAFLH